MIGLALLLTQSIGATADDVSCNSLDWQNCSIPLNPVIDFVTKLVEHVDEMTGEVVSGNIETVGDKVNEVFGDKPE
jgi:hypothetical protein